MKPRAALTPRQNEIYEFIRANIHKKQAAPTMVEIGQRFGMRSTNGVNDALNTLERKGYIKRLRGSARGIALTDGAPAATTAQKGVKKIPVAGAGDAANPFSIFMNPEGMVHIDTTLMTGANLFAVIVTDDAMSGEGIHKGDYAVVRQMPQCPDGALVFALHGAEQLVRRLQGWRLTAANKFYKPVPFRQDDGQVAVVGIVVGLIRTLNHQAEADE